MVMIGESVDKQVVELFYVLQLLLSMKNIPARISRHVWFQAILLFFRCKIVVPRYTYRVERQRKAEFLSTKTDWKEVTRC